MATRQLPDETRRMRVRWSAPTRPRSMAIAAAVGLVGIILATTGEGHLACDSLRARLSVIEDRHPTGAAQSWEDILALQEHDVTVQAYRDADERVRILHAVDEQGCT